MEKSNTPVETVYLFDLDRLAFDTGAFADKFEQFTASYDPGISETLARHRQKVERSGGSYDLLKGLERSLGRVATLQVVSGFSEEVLRGDKDFIFPEAKEAINLIQKRADARLAFITRGGPMQKVKLQSSKDTRGVGAHIVSPNASNKSTLINSWREGEVFTVPTDRGTITARRVVLAEDKMSELDGLEAQDSSAQGYLVLEHAREVDIEAAKEGVPPNVTVVETLGEMMRREGLV